MKRFILILVALLVVATGFAQPKKVNLDIKALKELVGTADRVKMNEVLKYQSTLDSGEDVFQGFNEYEQLLLAYRCRFNKNEILWNIEFGTPYPFGYHLDLTVEHGVKPYVKENPYEGLPTFFEYKWDGREIIIDSMKQTVIVSKPDAR